MFGRRKESYKSPKISTIIGQQTEIVGDVKFSGGLHVDGVIRGNVFATEETDAVLTLSEHGLIEGEIHVPNVLLNGAVKGDVYASSHIELANKARVTGSVYYNLLEMEMGAEVNGNLERTTAENWPMLSYDVSSVVAEISEANG